MNFNRDGLNSGGGVRLVTVEGVVANVGAVIISSIGVSGRARTTSSGVVVAADASDGGWDDLDLDLTVSTVARRGGIRGPGTTGVVALASLAVGIVCEEVGLGGRAASVSLVACGDSAVGDAEERCCSPESGGAAGPRALSSISAGLLVDLEEGRGGRNSRSNGELVRVGKNQGVRQAAVSDIGLGAQVVGTHHGVSAVSSGGKDIGTDSGGTAISLVALGTNADEVLRRG